MREARINPGMAQRYGMFNNSQMKLDMTEEMAVDLQEVIQGWGFLQAKLEATNSEMTQ